MASSSSWKSPFTGQDMSETKTFTWRLRPHATHLTGSEAAAASSSIGGGIGKNDTTATATSLNPTARYSKSTNLAGLTRGLASAVGGTTTTQNSYVVGGASHSLSSSVLPTTSSILQLQQQQQQQQQLEKFLRFQEFEVEVGQTLGLHSMWSLFLISCGSTTLTNQKSNTNLSTGTVGGGNASSSAAGNSSSSPSSNSDFVGLFLRKIMKPLKSHNSSYNSAGDQVVARYKIEIMDRDGEIIYKNELESEGKDKLEMGLWDWKKIVPISTFYSNKSKLPGGGKDGSFMESGNTNSEDSVLLLRVSFTLVSRKKGKGIGKLANGVDYQKNEEEISRGQAANAFLSLVGTPSGGKPLVPDVVIEIPNRKKFSVHKKMLIERSSLFKKLLDPESKEKIRGNVVRVDDVSVNGMELILRHIYSGQLEEEWITNPATIMELISASDKYGLPALKEFCSKHLVRAANKNNCYKLMEVAKLHNLEQAAEELMSYVSDGLGSNINSRKASEESVDSGKSNES